MNVYNLSFPPFGHAPSLFAVFFVHTMVCHNPSLALTWQREYSNCARLFGGTYPILPPPPPWLSLHNETHDASLTRSCVFFGEGGTAGTVMEKGAFYREGMVGVSLTGDIRMRSFVSQGARRVGPTFNADKVFLLFQHTCFPNLSSSPSTQSWKPHGDGICLFVLPPFRRLSPPTSSCFVLPLYMPLGMIPES